MILDKPKAIPPVLPNLGIEYWYRKKLWCLIEQMHNSILYWIMSAYKNNAPKMANDGSTELASLPVGSPHPILKLLTSTVGLKDPPPSLEVEELSLALLGADALPSTTLRRALAKLVTRWQRKFKEAAPDLAKRFTTDVANMTDVAFMNLLKKNKISVRFTNNHSRKDVLQATVQQNVALIKSIPAQYLSQVQGVVMRSVQTGASQKQLAKSLADHFQISKRKAALIAQHQNSSATEALHRARRLELGISKAVWKHSHQDKHPRPTHLKMDGRKFDVRKGMWDSAIQEYVFPGQLPGCTCTSFSVIPGLGS